MYIYTYISHWCACAKVVISGSEKGMICPIEMEYSETFREYAFIAVMLPSVNRNQHYLFTPRPFEIKTRLENESANRMELVWTNTVRKRKFETYTMLKVGIVMRVIYVYICIYMFYFYRSMWPPRGPSLAMTDEWACWQFCHFWMFAFLFIRFSTILGPNPDLKF